MMSAMAAGIVDQKSAFLPAVMQWLRHVEDVVLALVFFALLLLPLVEIALRAALGIGISGSAPIVLHLTLAVGMLGAAVAARQNRLLGFSAAALFPDKHVPKLRFAAHSVAAAATMLMLIAALQFVAAERLSGHTLAYNFPVWAAQLVLPAGMALVWWRLVMHSGTGLAARIGAALLGLALAVPVLLNFPPQSVVTPALVMLLAAMIAGAPLFAIIGGAALVLLWSTGVPIASVAVNHYSLASNPSLPAIPLFTLAGYFLAESRAPGRLVEVFDSLFGRFRGGAAIVTVLALTFFTSFTGASGVAILALGGLAMPLLTGAGYGKRARLAMLTGGGLPGVLLFPALPLILYAIVARTSIEDMFIGGILPMLLMTAIVLVWALRQTPAAKHVRRIAFDAGRARRALWAAKWDLAMPLVPLGILLGGIATAVEAAAATAFYAFMVATVIHRDIHVIRDIPRIVGECGLLVGGILLVLGVSLALTNFMVDAQIPGQAVDWVRQHIQSPWAFLLALNLFLLMVGCVMDIFSAIVVITPLIVPIGLAFGIHPVHLGVILLANLELGYLTPPVGLNLFFSSYRFGVPIMEVCRAVTSLFAALAAGVLTITYAPWLSTGLITWLR